MYQRREYARKPRLFQKTASALGISCPTQLVGNKTAYTSYTYGGMRLDASLASKAKSLLGIKVLTWAPLSIHDIGFYQALQISSPPEMWISSLALPTLSEGAPKFLKTFPISSRKKLGNARPMMVTPPTLQTSSLIAGAREFRKEALDGEGPSNSKAPLGDACLCTRGQ